MRKRTRWLKCPRTVLDANRGCEERRDKPTVQRAVGGWREAADDPRARRAIDRQNEFLAKGLEEEEKEETTDDCRR